MRKNTKKRQNLKGFTLVEIIVVLVIIGILASVTIVALTGYIDKSKDKVAVMEAKRWYIAAQAAVSEVYADGNITMSQGEPVTLENGITVEGVMEGYVSVGTLGRIQAAATDGRFPSVSGNEKVAALTLQYMDSLNASDNEAEYNFPNISTAYSSDKSGNCVIGGNQKPNQYFGESGYTGNTYVYITFQDDGTMSSVTYSKKGYSGVVKLTRTNKGFDYAIKDTEGASKEYNRK